MELYLAGTDVSACIDPGFPIRSRYTQNPIGPFGELTPGGQPYHMAAALSDDIFNQFLFSAFVKGIVCLVPSDLGQTMKGHDLANLIGEDVPEELAEMFDLDWLFQLYPVNIPLL